MNEDVSTTRFYGDLAEWWPLISPVEDYQEEAAYFAGLLRSGAHPAREVLELGSGGGHNAFHLKREFALTLVDLSEGMLEVSRRLNPECAHQIGDMRSVRLGKTFDAVFAHDAVDYMATHDDLRNLTETAFIHCRPEGVAIFAPDATRESFREDTNHGGADAPDGRAARFLEWTRDPAPDDSWALVDYAFLLRDADGSVRSVHETHRIGVFSIAEWLAALDAAGFAAEAVDEITAEDRPPRKIFLGRRPR